MPPHRGDTHHFCLLFSGSAGDLGTPNFRRERKVMSRIRREAGTGEQKLLTTGGYHYSHFTDGNIETQRSYPRSHSWQLAEPAFVLRSVSLQTPDFSLLGNAYAMQTIWTSSHR